MSAFLALTVAADTLCRDFRHAVRMHARRAASTVAVVATLALGIGANTTMFSIADSPAVAISRPRHPGERVNPVEYVDPEHPERTARVESCIHR